MAKPQKVLKNNPYAPPTFWYPEELGNMGSEPYVIFDVRHSVVLGGGSKGTIALPFPNDLSIGYGMQYSDQEVSPDVLSKMFSDLVSGRIPTTEEVWGSVKDTGGHIASKGVLLNDNVRAQLEQGKIAHPHAATVFQGVGFRTFSLNYAFLAKNQAESVAIHNIIYNFKYHMHPQLAEGEAGMKFFLFPEEFIIGFFAPASSNNGDEFLFKLRNCVLENMTVNYNGSGIPVFFQETGAPVDIRMTLAFKERELLTKQRIEEGC